MRNKLIHVFSSGFRLLLVCTFPVCLYAQTIQVPKDVPGIGQAIQLAKSGDTILVAPGEYRETLRLDNKNIILASWFIKSGDTTFVSRTIIDGKGGDSVIDIKGTNGDSTAIIGFTLRNAEDGIMPRSKFGLLHCRVTGTKDGVDYESGSGGLCRNNVFEYNKDDGIDLDADVEILIENNMIRYNNGDGIEIRLQPYNGKMLQYVIRGNTITRNKDDGIQIIDYPGISDRQFLIEQNIIHHNGMAGIGLMGNANSKENYEGAPIPERIQVKNNVLDSNNHGITGGANMQVVNNIIMHSSGPGLKNVAGKSQVAYNLFWHNGKDFTNTQIDMATTIRKDPRLSKEYTLLPGSPALGAGSPNCKTPAGKACNIGLSTVL